MNPCRKGPRTAEKVQLHVSSFRADGNDDIEERSQIEPFRKADVKYQDRALKTRKAECRVTGEESTGAHALRDGSDDRLSAADPREWRISQRRNGSDFFSKQEGSPPSGKREGKWIFISDKAIEIKWRIEKHRGQVNSFKYYSFILCWWLPTEINQVSDRFPPPPEAALSSSPLVEISGIDGERNPTKEKWYLLSFPTETRIFSLSPAVFSPFSSINCPWRALGTCIKIMSPKRNFLKIAPNYITL